MKFTLTGDVVQPGAAWSVLGDSDFLNRAADNGRLRTLEMVNDRAGYPRAVGVFDAPLGLPMAFEEFDASWVFQRRFTQRRRFSRTVVKATTLDVRLTPEGEGVIPQVTLDFEPSNFLLRPVVKVRIGQFERAWRRIIDALPKPGEPALVDVEKRVLGGEVRTALGRWRSAGASGLVVDALADHLETARPTELKQIRAFRVADSLGLQRREVLEALLLGVNTGAFELYWSVRCPACQGQVGASQSLTNIDAHAACASCRFDFEVDVGEMVEVVFAPHESLGLRPDEQFCTLFPSGSTGMRAAFVLEPGAEHTEAVPLAPGEWRLSSGLGREPTTFTVADTADQIDRSAGSALSWSHTAGTSSENLVAGDVPFKLVNDTDAWTRVVVTPSRLADDRVTGSVMTSFPAFRRLMGNQVLAPGVSVSVRSVAVLFTDLTGSVAFYDAVGDAEAYAYIRDHFDVLREHIHANDGAIVKTIGDAVMASFSTPAAAMAAAIELGHAYIEWSGQRALPVIPQLRVALHSGPALAVQSDQAGIDYFGTTVNLAARAEGMAGGREIVWTRMLHEAPGVASVVEAAGLEVETFDTPVKGLDEPLHMLRAKL